MRMITVAMSAILILLFGSGTAASAAPTTNVIYGDDYTTITTQDRGSQTFVTVANERYYDKEADIRTDLTLSNGSTLTVYGADTVRLPRNASVTDILVTYPSTFSCAGDICVTYFYDPANGGQCKIRIDNPTTWTVTVTVGRSDAVVGQFVVDPGDVANVTVAGACVDTISWNLE